MLLYGEKSKIVWHVHVIRLSWSELLFIHLRNKANSVGNQIAEKSQSDIWQRYIV